MGDLSKYSDQDIINIISADAESELRERGYAYGWYKKEPFVGAIYVLVNPAFPNLVKIGYADDVAKRMKQFNSSSGIPDPYHCYAIYKVKKRLEDLKLHKLIDTLDPSLRHTKNKEFYEMDSEKAYEILSAIAQINGDEEQLSKNPFADAYFDQIKKSGKKKTNSTTSSAQSDKKSILRFSSIGIPKGETLVFVKDPNITCTTVDDSNHVEYKGKTYSISGLAKLLLKTSAAHGGRYFMYKGETLTEIRERLGV